MIGDYYLATGGTGTWKPFPTKPSSPTTLGDMFAGNGTGTCDVFPNG